MKTRLILLWVLIGFFASPQCHHQSDCFCTEVFIMQMVQVLDESLQPVTDVNLTVTFSDSGNPIDCSQYHDALNGYYCILNDNYVHHLDGDGEDVTVIFEKSGFQTQIQTYLFNTDPCRCHINLLEGKTTVTLVSR